MTVTHDKTDNDLRLIEDYIPSKPSPPRRGAKNRSARATSARCTWGGRAAGTLGLIVEAHKADGFDPQWVQNAVLEPLDETDIDVA